MNADDTSLFTDSDFDFIDEDSSQEDKAAKAVRYAADLEKQFVALPMAIFADVRAERLKHRDVCLYMHLLVKQGENRTLFWGVDSLALLTGTSATNVKDSLRRLVACGYIKRRLRGTNTAHTICLTRLHPRHGVEGMCVRGKRIGTNQLEKQDDTAEPAPRKPQPSHVPRTSKKSSTADSQASHEDDADAEGMQKFLKEWDEYFAPMEPKTQSRRWSAIPSLK